MIARRSRGPARRGPATTARRWGSRRSAARRTAARRSRRTPAPARRGRGRRDSSARARPGRRPARPRRSRPSRSATPGGAAGRRSTSARKIELSPLWLPGRTMTSLGVGGVTPSGVSGAELLREPRLQVGQTGDRRPRQRRVAARRAGQGRAHQPFGQQLAVRVAGVQRDHVVRRAAHGGRDAPGSAPAARAAPRSASRSPTAAPSGRRARTSRRRAGSRSGPAPARSRSAFCTVTGLARCCCHQGAGRRQPARPAAAVEIQVRSAAAIRELLSSFMTQQ